MNWLCRLFEMKKIRDSDLDARVYGAPITAVLSYSKGFACALATGTVFLFEKFLEDSYKRSREIQVCARNIRMEDEETSIIP